MRAHATGRLKWRVSARDWLRFWWSVLVRGRVRVRIRSQEAPSAEPTGGQWCPRRAELRAQGGSSQDQSLAAKAAQVN